jgi:hypothetical protein
MKNSPACFWLLLAGLVGSLSAQVAQVRRAPALSGTVEGSVQVMTAESMTLNGGATVTGDLLVPGTPTVRLNGHPTYTGTVDGTGAATPTNHKVTLNGNASLRNIVRRTDAVTLPTVAAPPPPTGTRNVSLNNTGDSPGDFATLRDLSLNGNAGAITVPPGAYGKFTANGGGSFTLGVAGATTPAVYHFRRLTLNGSSRLDVAGPVIVTLAEDVSANGSLGNSAHPEWLTLKLAAGGLTLNGNVSVYGYVTAPSGTVTINGSSQLVGGLIADQLTINGHGLLRLLAPPLPFLANFEPAEGYQPGLLHGQNGWSVTGPASIVASPVYAGQQAVSVAPATPPALLVRAFANDDPGVTFVDFFARPAAAPAAADGVFLDTDAARVALTGAGGAPGRLQVFQGDGAGGGAWFSTGIGPVLDAGGRATDWLRLTTREDYAAKKWDLYYNGRMVAADLGFINNTSAAFTGLGLSGHSALATGFDDLLVAFDNPLFADADYDGMEDVWETAHGLNPALNDRDGDPDADGLTNIQEYLLGTDPNNPDTDGDGLPDPQEVTLGTNPTAADTDGDGLPDGWEKAHALNPLSAADAALDSDGDGVSNLAEFTADTGPLDFYNAVAPQITSQVGPDGQLDMDGVVAVRLTKADGTPWVNAPVYFIAGADTLEGFAAASLKDIAEIQALLTGTSAVRTDAQGEARIVIDSLLTIPWPLTIYPVGTNAGAPLFQTVWPQGRDGNGNQLADAWEQLYFNSGLAAAGDDPDTDGLTNGQEERAGTHPLQADTDGDSLTDGWELAHGSNPLAGESPAVLDEDADGDGLTLREEAVAGTDPARNDSDGDGLPDGYEVRAGINPLTDDRGLDPDGDGLTNEQERGRGTDPTDYYNGAPHTILPFIGGEGDLGAFNLLAVRVVAGDGTPLVNAPVSFAVDPGEEISLTPSGPRLGRTAEVRTGPGGIARIYLHGPGSPE